jgi:hypothetical protein
VRLVAVVPASVALLATLLATTPLRGQDDTPRLLVVVAVDQMRADYLTVLERHWRSGFRTLLTEGAVFERNEYPYLNTVTCAGHATIGTGVFPRTHGIVGNTWWDRGRNALVDCSIDERPSGAHISYGRRVLAGNSAHLLRAQTLGDRLREQRPGARIVSLSMKPDTAVMLAGHGGDVVLWFDQLMGAFVTSRAYAERRTPAVTDFLTHNPLSKDMSGTWVLREPAADYVFADATPGQRPQAGRDGLFPHAIAGPKGPDERSPGFWAESPLSDRYLARMALGMVDSLQMGRDATPDLLAVGFSALDYLGHRFGPRSREVEEILINLDFTLGELIAGLDQRLGRNGYVLALSADHGVGTAFEPAKGGTRVIIEDIEERLEELLRTRWGAGTGNYVAVRAPYVYFAAGVEQRLRTDTALWRTVLSQLEDTDGIARVLPAADLSPTSDDPAVRAAALSYADGRGGDLVLITEPNWLLLGRNVANAASHGTLHEYDRRVPLLLFGGRVRAGRFDARSTPADIAPTLASLVNVMLPGAEGRVLKEALK